MCMLSCKPGLCLCRGLLRVVSRQHGSVNLAPWLLVIRVLSW